MLDRRLHAFRPDLADVALKGQVEAARFVTPEPAMVVQPVVALRPKADPSIGIDTELLMGEEVRVFERENGWAWVQAVDDGYVGYLPEATLGGVTTATHVVAVPRTFVYSGPDLRFPTRLALSMGSRLTIIGEAETRGTRYFLLADGGALVARHLRPVSDPPAIDYVSVAAFFLETPYLWGGKSGFGIDCSGLVQLAMRMAGLRAPRDSDMQASGLGVPIERNELRRGDLVFWKGHVAIMEDETSMIHANGHTMSVARETLDAAIERIGWLYGTPTGYRRPVAET
ncbi:cell wall-associated NlpC family hydrolase [Peteryoungia aggregata LMG 23059]|uniref:Cell wall-associated NlpC family hydrolase n=1 Tax=Peteryoungia aggregata LMG 23059 TaxID=1368425 RepID=A0ABU0G4G4_9HYPH|nr:C40 family peptidase [Peteryoungia aggregata]MDQ0420226.1 cell wall-associated NlpC family hydrolase [Peteryoungia aggregata LMG 23059]